MASGGTVERLRALTLMTYADISAVNPSAMTPWRAEVLWQLYLLTYSELTRELATDRIVGPASDDRPRTSVLAGLPVRYTRTHIAGRDRRAFSSRPGTSASAELPWPSTS